MIETRTIDGIKFVYSEGYLPTPRCRKLRYRDVEGETSVEVTALTDPDKEAPVAFRFPDSDLTRAMGKEYYGDEAERVSKEIRLFQGKLYERDHNGNHYCGGQGWYDYKTFCECLRSFRRRYCFELGKTPDTLEDYQVAIPGSVSGTVLMIHDGGEIEIWRECGEPRYMFNTFGLGHNHGGTALFIEQHYNSNIPNSHYFSALQREEAVEAATATALRRGDDQYINMIHGCEMIEVLIPEAVKLDPMHEHGDGDPFINRLNALTEAADSPFEAGLLVMATAMKGED